MLERQQAALRSRLSLLGAQARAGRDVRGWIEADRAFRVWQEGLRAAMRQWQANDRDQGGLLRGAPLITAETWLAERGSELSPAERGFIDDSAAFRASEQARRERRRRMIVGGLAGGLAIALILLAVAISQGIAASESAEQAAQSAATAEAERSKTEIEVVARSTAQANAEASELDALTQASIGLASQSVLELQRGVPERAVPLALEAVENYPYTWQAERALSQAVFGNHLRQVLVNDGGVNTALWSPDGARIVTATDKEARIWDAETGALLFVLQPDSSMYGAGWSPDGSRAWINGNGFASLWDAMTGEYLFTLSSHEGWLSMLSWSPDGKRILSTGQDTTARIWDATTGEELVLFSGHGAASSSCVSHCTPETSAWSPNGERVVTMDEAGEVFIWDPETGEELLELSGHTAWVDSAIWSPDGQLIATSSDDNTSRIWDATTGQELRSYVGDGGEAYARWSPQGDRVLLIYSMNDLLVVWDASNGEEIVNFRGHENKVLWADWSADGSRIVSGGQDGKALIWDSATGEVLYEFAGHAKDVNFVRWSPTNDQIVTASDDGTAKIWSLAAQMTALEIPGDPGGAWALDWSPSDKCVARNYMDGSVHIFDAVTGKELAVTEAQTGRNTAIVNVEFSPTGDRIMTAAIGGLAIVYDANTGEKRTQVGQEITWGFNDADWSPNGTEFATGSWDGSVQIWNAETGDLRLTFNEHRATVSWLLWSPDGQRIASTSEGQAIIWKSSTGDVLASLYPEDFEFDLGQPSWSPDGTRLALYSADGKITIWDAATGQPLNTLPASGAAIALVSWFPEQDRILTSDWGGNIKIWDIAKGTEVASFSFPNSLAGLLSHDGRQFVVGVWPDGPMVIVDVWQNLDELIELAKECCVFRELTPEERQQFGLPPAKQ